jgi:iron-sulfur cluster assembly protein
MRPKPKLLTLTDAAADRIKAIIAKSDKSIAGLRLSIEKSGCAGVGYKMDYAEAPAPGDEIVEDKGVSLFIDPKAVLFVLGMSIDYRKDKMSASFHFDNPNQVSACGCGESVELKAASTDALGAARARD